MDSEPKEARPDPGSALSPFAALYLAVVLGAVWLTYGLAMVGGTSAAAGLPLLTGAGILLATLDPGDSSLAGATLVATVVVGAACALWVARRFTGSELGFPWQLLGTLLAVVAVVVPLEWCGDDLVPPSLSVTPVVSLSALLLAAIPIALLGASFRLCVSTFGALSSRPFVAGMAAGIATLLLVPPASAGVAVLAVLEAVEAAQQQDVAPASEPVESTPILFGVEQFDHGAESDLEACLRRLAAERAKVEWNVRLKYRLSATDAEDVASDALLAVCTSSSLSTYRDLLAVYQTSANRRATDIVKARRGEPLDETILCLPYLPDDLRLISEINLANRALHRLDETSQDAMRLWSEERSHDEIASRLGISTRQSRDLVGNGLKSMRRYVADQCAYPNR